MLKQIIATLSLVALLGVFALGQDPPASSSQQNLSAEKTKMTSSKDSKKKAKKKSKRKHKK